MNPASTRNIRCAIYTRKSSEEGLEQDFNSLDAQREACAAYVASQASEGWSLLPEMYDDGGLSGGSLERPALQRILADVKSGQIDTIVVYKVDRLTRSLLDFAKLVEAFDAAEVSFVSVTQSFNTTTSMGRLTLNMLLSFAQFEREVTAERIRDKIAQSKARGMWMGGTPPLGYEPDGKNSLAIVESHAALIRDIYDRYRKLGNVRLVADSLVQEGIVAPKRLTKSGSTFGGCEFTRGQLYHILRNPTYAGNIPHKGKIHPGNHKAIIEPDAWEAVQKQLAENVRGTRKARERSSALLTGKLFDHQGEPLIPVHTCKPAGESGARRRYCYYVSKSAHHDAGSGLGSSLRIPAKEVEQVARVGLAEALADPLKVLAQLDPGLPPHLYQVTANRIMKLKEKIDVDGKRSARKILERLVVHPHKLELILSVQALASILEIELHADAPAFLRHESNVRLTRSGHSLKLVDESGVSASSTTPDRTLINLLIQAKRWWDELAKGETDIAKLSRREGVTASWMTRVVRLAFLAPEVIEALLSGKLPTAIDGKAILAPNAIAASWGNQTQCILAAE
uniref:recombinase family protein n=1 Tax=uncultured Altererythrobacter sp. TaxID=500840 RepID=UPI00261F0FDB|nr:recombinase family protein [uncultured Altererythrobacter sp.]